MVTMTTMTDVHVVMDRSDPVIIEESLVGGELHKLLKSRQFKVRSKLDSIRFIFIIIT